MSKVRFCWLCGKKLYGNHSAELVIDDHLRTLHKACAKQVKKGYDFGKYGDQYFSMIWQPSGTIEY